MFVGHYGVSFAAKSLERTIPLWVLFVAVQLLDVAWAPFILFGIEKVRIVPGITATNPLDLYYMPYTHGLLAAMVWSAAAFFVYLFGKGRSASDRTAALIVGLAVFSHWVLDFVVHRPDLPLFDDRWKVGLGLWNRPALALAAEGGVLAFGLLLYVRKQVKSRQRAFWTVAFAALMFAAHTYTFFGAPPTSGTAAAVSGLLAYAVFAGGARLVDAA